MKNKYILLRHGQTIYQTRKEHLSYPWPDLITSLTKRGKKQVKAASEKLKSKKIDLIYSSDFLRTQQTAEIVAEKLGLKVKLDKRLRDINWGNFKDSPVEKYLRFFNSERQRFSKRPSGGENWRDLKKRVVNLIKDIGKNHKNKTILIISHADPIWLLVGFLKRLTEKELLERRNKNDLWPDVGQFIEL